MKLGRNLLPALAWGLPVLLAVVSGVWLAAQQPSALDRQLSRARDDIRALRMALLRTDGGLPNTEPGLAVLVERGAVEHLPLDPWGRPYLYRNPGRDYSFDLLSLGPDGRESADDIVHWNLYGGR